MTKRDMTGRAAEFAAEIQRLGPYPDRRKVVDIILEAVSAYDRMGEPACLRCKRRRKPWRRKLCRLCAQMDLLPGS